MVKTLCVSMPNEDKAFCKSRGLSPSKLLQERISQIRDENNPSLVKNLIEERKHSANLQAKNEYISKKVNNIFENLQSKLSKEELDDLLQKT